MKRSGIGTRREKKNLNDVKKNIYTDFIEDDEMKIRKGIEIEGKIKRKKCQRRRRNWRRKIERNRESFLRYSKNPCLLMASLISNYNYSERLNKSPKKSGNSEIT